MVLNDEQNERFFDVMDSLLYYVNDRFRVVEHFTLDYANPIDDVKSSLVAHELWSNVGIIDEFVRDNPSHLSQRCLDIALSWKSALRGFFTLVRYQSGRALLMSEAGVFSVSGVTYELEHEIGPAPAFVEAVLLPFEDRIVYDGFLQAYETDQSPAELQRIQDEFENRCSKGIAVTADEFMKQADAYLAIQRDKELDALLAGVAAGPSAGEETLPAGFHRGPLAGLASDERRRAIEEHLPHRFAPTHISAKDFDKRAVKKEPLDSLKECLSLLTKADLELIARALGMRSLIKLKKAEMVAELAAELPNNPEALTARLLLVSDDDYELVRRLSNEGRIAFGLDQRGEFATAHAMAPYTFLFRGSGYYAFVVPNELRPLLGAFDFEATDRIRRQQKQAMACVDACVLMCGIASIDDVYDQYRALVSDVLDRSEFEQLVETESYLPGAGFGIWTFLPNDYLVHYTLTPEFVATEFAREQRGALGDLMRNPVTHEFSAGPFRQIIERARADLAGELERLEEYKREIVESQSNLPMKPLSRTLLENDVFDELLDDENVVRLRSFIDAHLPDGCDDYLYADYVVEEIVISSIESGSLQDVFSYLMQLGLDGCTHDEERLPILVTNVLNAMPSWENNGWSPRELYEQVTGRKMFYNDDGSLMKVGADDPCPCKSGKKYRDCCGR